MTDDKKFRVHKSVSVQIFKIDQQRRLVTGVVSEPDTIDLQNDIILADDIEKAAYGFMEKGGIIGYMHQEKADAKPVEFYIAPADIYLDKSESDSFIRKGSWVMTTYINEDRAWGEILMGKINSYSIGGWGNRIPINQENIQAEDGLEITEVYQLTDLEVEEVSLVTLGANNKKFVARKSEDKNGIIWFSKIEDVNKGVDDMAITDVEKAALEKELREKLEKEAAEKIAEIEKVRTEKEKALIERLEKAEKSAADSAEAARVEKEERLNREFIEKARAFPMIGNEIILGMALKEVALKTSEETYKGIVEMFKAANEKIKQSEHFKEIGKESDGVIETDAFGKLNKIATEIAAKENISMANAFTKAAKQNKELYKEYTESVTRRV